MARPPHLYRRGWQWKDVGRLAAHVVRVFVKNGGIDLAGAVAYRRRRGGVIYPGCLLWSSVSKPWSAGKSKTSRKHSR
jgi:hypothetical protein